MGDNDNDDIIFWSNGETRLSTGIGPTGLVQELMTSLSRFLVKVTESRSSTGHSNYLPRAPRGVNTAQRGRQQTRNNSRSQPFGTLSILRSRCLRCFNYFDFPQPVYEVHRIIMYNLIYKIIKKLD